MGDEGAKQAAIVREIQEEQPKIDAAVKNWLAFKMASANTAATAQTPDAAQKAQMTFIAHARKILVAVNSFSLMPSPQWGALRPQGATQSGMSRMDQLSRYNVLHGMWERAAQVRGAKNTKLFGRAFLLACWPEIEAALLASTPASPPSTVLATPAFAVPSSSPSSSSSSSSSSLQATAPVEIWHNGELVKTIGSGSGGGSSSSSGVPAPCAPPSAAEAAAEAASAAAEAAAEAFRAFVRGFGRTIVHVTAAGGADGSDGNGTAAASSAAAVPGIADAAALEEAEAAEAAELVWATDFDGVLRRRQAQRKADAAKRMEAEAEAQKQFDADVEQYNLLRAATTAPQEYDADDTDELEEAEEEGGGAGAAADE